LERERLQEEARAKIEAAEQAAKQQQAEMLMKQKAMEESMAKQQEEMQAQMQAQMQKTMEEQMQKQMEMQSQMEERMRKMEEMQAQKMAEQEKQMQENLMRKEKELERRYSMTNSSIAAAELSDEARSAMDANRFNGNGEDHISDIGFDDSVSAVNGGQDAALARPQLQKIVEEMAKQQMVKHMQEKDVEMQEKEKANALLMEKQKAMEQELKNLKETADRLNAADERKRAGSQHTPVAAEAYSPIQLSPPANATPAAANPSPLSGIGHRMSASPDSTPSSRHPHSSRKVHSIIARDDLSSRRKSVAKEAFDVMYDKSDMTGQGSSDRARPPPIGLPIQADASGSFQAQKQRAWWCEQRQFLMAELYEENSLSMRPTPNKNKAKQANKESSRQSIDQPAHLSAARDLGPMLDEMGEGIEHVCDAAPNFRG